MSFDYNEFLTSKMFCRINELKTFFPEKIEEELSRRGEIPFPHRKLVLVAADHNARMITAYGSNPVGLADRREYLSRLVRILYADSVDGVETTADIIEDLAALNYHTRETGGKDFLAGKVLIGTANRGGLLNTAWELDDRCTCVSVKRAVAMHLSGLKFMLRIHPDRVESGQMLSYCAGLIDEAAQAGLPVFIEGLYMDGNLKNLVIKKDLESLLKTVGVISALGSTSLRKWIELPLHPEYERAAGASSCSVLVVPDEIGQTKDELIKEYTEQSCLNGNIRGILLGRNVLYCKEDPMQIAETIAEVWHEVSGKE